MADKGRLEQLDQTHSPSSIRKWPSYCNRAAIFLSLTAVVATLIATTNGPGVHVDAVYYISSGVNLADGKGLTTLWGSPLTVFAPGLSVAVALGAGIGIDPLEFVRYFNALAFGIVVLLSYVLLRRHLSSWRLVVGGTAFVAVNAQLLPYVDRALSEPAFLVASLGFIIALEDLIATPAKNGPLVGAIGCCWLAFFFRYSGLALIPIGLVVLIIGLNRCGWRVATWRLAIFASGTSIAPAAWMLRNRSTDGTTLGPRIPSPDNLSDNLYRTLATVGRWFWPAPNLSVTQSHLAAFGASCIVFVVASLWLIRPIIGRIGSAIEFLPLIAFSVGYVAFIVATASVVAYDPIDMRLLLPVCVPLTVLAMVAFDRLGPRISLVSPVAAYAVGLLLACCLVGQAISFATIVRNDSLGQDFLAADWRNSKLIAAVGMLPDDAAVYTNEAHAIWLYTRHQPLYQNPNWPQGQVVDPVAVAESVGQGAACRPTYLAWFSRNTSNSRTHTYMEPADFDLGAVVRPISVLNDGTLYRIEYAGNEVNRPLCNLFGG